ncbi:molybdenum cofactor cytidylyltransferase [Paenibacillus taihuensis]|uniref:Molybdenum cofactor cytidylyltransferase n=1 Tax=Paenibacillus taihuensis TaxID=1156355 RepID=A0A3D9RJQ2_9BACL|nr:nucleotidyltransferase family protein [Paenibacillus taihuensis]REE80113.1 molybdenum cofactor cytidylyltransferase [Paenibacillus taihuensis]
MRIGCIYLAAGSSTRMGEPKLPLELAPGVTVGNQGLQELRYCGFHKLTVVVRPDDPLLWLCDRNRKERNAALPKFRITPCKDAGKGMSYSLRSGLISLLPEKLDAVLVTLADQPFISASLLKRLVYVYREDPSVHYVASGYGESVGTPLILNKSLFPQLLELDGDKGARHILKSPDYVGKVVRYAAEWTFMDIDTHEELEEARQLWSQRQMNVK